MLSQLFKFKGSVHFLLEILLEESFSVTILAVYISGVFHSFDGSDFVFWQPWSVITLLIVAYCTLLSQTFKSPGQELSRPQQMDRYLFSCLCTQLLCTTVLSAVDALLCGES